LALAYVLPRRGPQQAIRGVHPDEDDELQNRPRAGYTSSGLLGFQVK
jgi:hypothetical protein